MNPTRVGYLLGTLPVNHLSADCQAPCRGLPTPVKDCQDLLTFLRVRVLIFITCFFEAIQRYLTHSKCRFFQNESDI